MSDQLRSFFGCGLDDERTFDLDDYVWAAIRHGASGFMLKDTAAGDLAAAVRVVADGQALLAPTVTKRLIEHHRTSGLGAPSGELPGHDELTEREAEVFELLARGRSNAEIAAALYVGETTVKTHVGRVLAKLGLREQTRVESVSGSSWGKACSKLCHLLNPPAPALHESP